MYSTLYLNQESRTLINNIWMNTKNHPLYAGYRVTKDEISYADAGAIAIKICSSGGAMNMFLFYPAPNGSGKIGSCAIYGSSLEGHKNAIESSMKIFGMPIDSIEWDEGIERFLDVTLAAY